MLLLHPLLWLHCVVEGAFWRIVVQSVVNASENLNSLPLLLVVGDAAHHIDTGPRGS